MISGETKSQLCVVFLFLSLYKNVSIAKGLGIMGQPLISLCEMHG